MRRAVLRLVGAAVLAGTPLVVAATTASPAGADTNLIGWTAQADANVVDIVIDNAAGLAGSHPLSEIDVPEDFSDYESGPLGYALAALLWPGAVAGNAGSLLGEAGAPNQLAPLTDQLNDPIRAASFYPAGPSDANYPSGAPASGALEMTSHADANSSWAKAAVADMTIPSLVEVHTVAGSTSATATSAAQSTAAGSFQSLSLLGGLIQVGSTSATAAAQSDGVNPTGTAQTHLGAITIAGTPVSVGTDGVVVGPASTDPSGLLSSGPASVVDQVLSLLNLKITLLPQTQTSQAPAEQITSSGLQIAFSLPSSFNASLNCTSLPSQLAQLGILCTLPDVLQGLNVTVTIGRVTAEAVAAAPFASTEASSPSSTGTESSAPSSSGTTVPAFGIGSAAVPIPTPVSTSTGAGTGSTGEAPLPPQAIRRVSPVSLSSPTGAGVVAGLMVVAVLVGLGLRKVSGMLVAAPVASCPREEEP